MKIRSIHIENFGSVDDVSLENLGDFAVLVGRNGSGKSYVFEALSKFFEEFQLIGGTSTLQSVDYFWHRRRFSQPIRIALSMEMTEEDIGGIFRSAPDFVEDVRHGQPQSFTRLDVVRTLTHQQGWATELLQWADLPLIQSDSVVADHVLAQARRRKKPIPHWSLNLFSPGFSADNIGGERLLVHPPTNRAFFSGAPFDELARAGALGVSEEFVGVDYRQWCADRGLSLAEEPPTQEEAPELFALLGSAQTLVSAALVDRLKSAFKLVPAGRDAEVAPAGRQPLLRAEILDGLRVLSDSLTPEDDARLDHVRSAVESFLKKNVDPHPTQVLMRDRGLRLPVPHIGGGEQAIIGLMWELSEDTPIVAIEEPENHLHPDFARRLFVFLKDEASKRQVICSTHSAILVDKSTPTNNWAVRRVRQSTEVAPVQTRDELRLVLAELGVLPSDVFLNDLVVFVEGGTEREAVFPILGQKLGVNFEENIGLLSVGGEGNTEHFLRVWLEVMNLAPADYIVVLDAHSGPTKDRLTRDLGIDPDKFHVWDKDCIEDYYPAKYVVAALKDVFGVECTQKDVERPRTDKKVENILQSNNRIWRGWKIDLGRYVANKMEPKDIPRPVKQVFGDIKRLARQ